MANNLINSTKWTKDEEERLMNIYSQYDSLKDVPFHLLNFPGRTEKALKAKLNRLITSHNLTYSWTKEESRKVFHQYLQGVALKDIETEASLNELESELKRQRDKAEQIVRAYAEERGLQVNKYLSLETLNLFRNNYNTTSDFTRKALHNRIQNG
jgi:uncharacterized Zn finger protein